MKKLLSTLAITAIASLGLVACGGGNSAGNTENTVKVGMLTDSGSINDKSFNEGTWNGIEKFAANHEGIEKQFIQPSSQVTTELVSKAEDLILAGNEIIITAGFTFDEAVAQLQEAYPETKFVIIDSEPETMAENTVAIYFAEEQAGFLAGISAALETQSGKVGFIGGMEVPTVQRFGWGFLAGVAYANETFGLDVEVPAFQYTQTFIDPQVGKTLAGGMYDMGVDIIFSAAGSTGNGVISEAITRAENGENVFVIGVDSDQYEAGLMPNGSSIILTSALKRVDNAAYEILEKFVNGEFPGGEVMTLDASVDGVGIPEENQNLSDETQAKVNDALESIKTSEIVVPETAEELTTWFEEVGFDASGINY